MMQWGVVDVREYLCKFPSAVLHHPTRNVVRTRSFVSVDLTEGCPHTVRWQSKHLVIRTEKILLQVFCSSHQSERRTRSEQNKNRKLVPHERSLLTESSASLSTLRNSKGTTSKLESESEVFGKCGIIRSLM